MDVVSVVVPCFQAERWLGGAIESALAQTWPHVEVIVVDDGSTDASVEVARSYRDRVTVLTGPNQGPAAARNRGIGAARGAWVQFLDADDLLLPRKVEACLQAVTRPGDVPFGEAIPFGGPGSAAGTPRNPLEGTPSRVARWLVSPPPPFRSDALLETVLTRETQTSQPLYPIALLRRIGGFREELRWLEDIDLNVRLVLAGARFVPVREPLVLLRDHREPGRQRYHPGVILGRLRGESLMFETVRAAGAMSPALERVFADRIAYAARQAWRAGEQAAAEEAFHRALALHDRPAPTRVPLYNAIASRLGLARTERLLRAFG